MGGKLIPNSVRLPRLEHDILRQKIMDDLKNSLPEIRVGLTEALRDKKDFGDIDIIVDISPLGPFPIEPLREFLAEKYKIFESKLNAKVSYENFDPLHGRVILVQNRGVLSFGYPHEKGIVQIDLILTPELYFQITQDYFNWGGIGNLVGRAASQMGFGLGIEGLQYTCLAPSGQGKVSLLVSNQYSDILTFMGYDPIRFEKGFNCAEEIFEYVVTSPYFDPNLFLPENRSYDKRVRDERHPLHVGFLKWLEQNHFIPCEPITWNEKNHFLSKAAQVFPEFKQKLKALQLEVEKVAQNKIPFNGHMIQTWFGLEGKAIRDVLQKSKEAWENDEVFRQNWKNGNEKTHQELLSTFISVSLNIKRKI